MIFKHMGMEEFFRGKNSVRKGLIRPSEGTASFRRWLEKGQAAKAVKRSEKKEREYGVGI